MTLSAKPGDRLGKYKFYWASDILSILSTIDPAYKLKVKHAEEDIPKTEEKERSLRLASVRAAVFLIDGNEWGNWCATLTISEKVFYDLVSVSALC